MIRYQRWSGAHSIASPQTVLVAVMTAVPRCRAMNVARSSPHPTPGGQLPASASAGPRFPSTHGRELPLMSQ